MILDLCANWIASPHGEGSFGQFGLENGFILILFACETLVFLVNITQIVLIGSVL